MAERRNGLVLPVFGSLYEGLEPVAYAVARLAAGATIATFGMAKLFRGGMGNEIAEFHRLGLEPAHLLGWFIGGLECFGGLLLAIGLLTRPLALMFVVEMLVILFKVMIPRGAGYQPTLVWLGVFLLVLMRGGGRFSLDRLLGREF